MHSVRDTVTIFWEGITVLYFEGRRKRREGGREGGTEEKEDRREEGGERGGDEGAGRYKEETEVEIV